MGAKILTKTDKRVRGVASGSRVHALAAAFPLLPHDELKALAVDIKENGLRHPIVKLGDEILDGRNREQACALAGVQPRYEQFSGSLNEAMRFVVSENIKRRHLAPGQASAIVVDIKDIVEMAKKAAEERRRTGAGEAGKKKRKSAKSDDAKESALVRTPKHAASADIAAATGQAQRTIEQALHVKAADPDLHAQVKRGEITLKRAERILRDRAAANKRAERTKREAGVAAISMPDIRHGDFREVLADIRDVDLVFTDPPYPKEFLPLWSDLSKWASRALKPGHLLVAYSGGYYLPEVIQRLSEHLTYVWCGWLNTPGAACSIRNLPIMSSGKPVLVFSNGALSRTVATRRFRDVGKSEGRTRDQHEWEQAQGPAAFWIDDLTERGELVADPFVGSGTFALVAKTMGRRFVGAELDREHFNTARRQVA